MSEKKEKEFVDKAAFRRTPSNKVKLHRYYKGCISLMRDPVKASAYKKMLIDLLKETGELRAA